jgi:hypothetical protein
MAKDNSRFAVLVLKNILTTHDSLARRLDEGGLCERVKISREIKKILNDKISQGKKEKWIEDVYL